MNFYTCLLNFFYGTQHNIVVVKNTCHRPGQAGPFALTNYREAAAWALAIREVVDEGRMPPWHANRSHGKFANDPSLTPAEKRTIQRWVEGGRAEDHELATWHQQTTRLGGSKYTFHAECSFHCCFFWLSSRKTHSVCAFAGNSVREHCPAPISRARLIN